MMKTRYSHAYYVGAFNGHITPQDLKEGWEKVCSDEEYNWICSMYYQGHVDAILDVNEKRPAFLKDVCHYRFAYKADDKTNPGQNISLTKMKKNMQTEEFTYAFRLLNLHLYFFPLGIIIVAIEIDDSGTELNELTAAHNTMMSTEIYKREEWKSALCPILELLPSNDPSLILEIGNKFKLYQVIGIESEDIQDSLLFEVGTSSPIGCVGTKHPLAPSKAYYDSIIKSNVVSAFNNWKGLALMDSFTLISNASKREDWSWSQHFNLWNNHYFQLIYLRCLFNKTFCSSRNTNYRMTEDIQDISEEISKMERYYFYDKISHNFLPNLLCDAMSRGLELKEEREELSKQVKVRASEEKKVQKEIEEKMAQERKLKEEIKNKRFNRILAGVTVFAVISVIWDFCSIVKNAFNIGERSPYSPYFAWGFIALGIIIIVVLWNLILRKKDEEENKNNS